MPAPPSQPGGLVKLALLLQMIRLPMLLGAVSNTWVMILLARGLEPLERRPAAINDGHLWTYLGLTAVIAGGLHTYGIALNDLLDARHDRLFDPQRPVASGSIGQTTIVVLAVLSLLAALLAVVVLGTTSVLLALIAATGILFYNATGKYFPAVGILTLGLIRALNMLIPNPALSFAWPIWLTVTHVLVCWALAHHVLGKRPRLHAAQWWILCAGWAFFTLFLLQWVARREAMLQPHPPALWLWPGVAILAFIVVAWRILSGSDHSARARNLAGKAFLRLALMWLIIYDLAWLLGDGLYREAALLALLLLVALVSSRLNTWLNPQPLWRLPGPATAITHLDG